MYTEILDDLTLKPTDRKVLQSHVLQSLVRATQTHPRKRGFNRLSRIKKIKNKSYKPSLSYSFSSSAAKASYCKKLKNSPTSKNILGAVIVLLWVG